LEEWEWKKTSLTPLFSKGAPAEERIKFQSRERLFLNRDTETETS
jgi:hypothetical protein